MRRVVVVCMVALGSSCSQGTTSSGSAGEQDIRSVCAPTVTRSGERANIRVRGGCSPDAAQYTCEVRVLSSSITVRLLGPVDAPADCGTVDKACFIPALQEGSYALEFAAGEEFNRTLDVGPEHAMFDCWSDAGM